MSQIFKEFLDSIRVDEISALARVVEKKTEDEDENDAVDVDVDDEEEPEQKPKPKAVKKDKKLKPKFNPQKYVEVKPELVEAPASDVAVIAFGRMNPITIGHEKLVNAVISTGLKEGGVPLIYLSHSTDPKKNPLTYDQKIAFAKKAFGTKLIVKSKARTIIEVAKELQNKFKKLIIVAGSDRVAEFDTLLNKYNGKEYTYDSIRVVSAGERDPDADDVSGMSASKMRALAMDGDMEGFKNGLPKKLQSQAQRVYTAVRAGMGIREAVEELELSEALTRQQRLKRKMIMRRLKSKILAGRRRAMRRKATSKVIQKRAKKMVLRMLKQRFAKSNRYADLPYSARQRIDDRIKRIPQARLNILMKRYIPKIRKIERDRFAAKVAKQKAPDAYKPTVSVVKTKAIESVDVNLSFEKFLSERVMSGKVDALSPMGKSKLTGPEVARYYKNNPSAKRAARDEKIKLGIELALDLSGNMNYAIKEIEKLKKGLSRHAEIQKALRYANESFKEQKYSEYTLEKRLEEGASYHSGLSKSTAAKRQAQFNKQAKMDDDNPAAYKPAPGDATAKTKTSKHTTKFKKIFGETNFEKANLTRPHMLLDKKGAVVIDKRFRMFRKAKEVDTLLAQATNEEKIQEINELIESVEFVFESNPNKSLRDKAEKTGISYSILKKVFDRGVAAWRTGHRPGTTPTQWGLARVNSFATGGKTQKTTDKDLWDQHKGSKND